MKKLFAIILIGTMLVGISACAQFNALVQTPDVTVESLVIEPGNIKVPINTEETNKTEETNPLEVNPETTEDSVSTDVTEQTYNNSTEHSGTTPHNVEPTEPKPSTNPNQPTQPKHEHNYQSKVVAPTCTAQGYTQYTCSCGHSYKQNYVAALDHNYVDKVIEPTTSAEGYTEHTCSRCGKGYKDNYTPKVKKIYDTSAVVAAGNAYAQSLGATIDYSLGFNNAGYSFPIQEFPDYTPGDFNAKLLETMYWCVNNVKSLGEMRGHGFEGYRINCYIEYHADDNSYWCYCFYG